jgi:RNA polymerase sigma-70 factor (ECF subfamily)
MIENRDYFCVKCLVEGDEDAFVELYNKYHRKIYYSALKITQSKVLAQDVTQNVFLKIWDIHSSLDPDQNFEAFISVICRNAIFDIFKKSTREEAVKMELQQFAETSESIQEDEEYHEAYKNILYKAISKLPPQRRIVFELCKLQEKTYEEVAHSLKISQSTVQDHIVKANKFIREYLLTCTKIIDF